MERSEASAFRVDLGTVALALSYKGLYLGTGVGAGTVVQPGSNDVTLQGTLVRQEGADALATTSGLFTKYPNGESADVVRRPRGESAACAVSIRGRDCADQEH